MDFQEIFLDNFSDIFAGRTNAQGRSFAETGSGFSRFEAGTVRPAPGRTERIRTGRTEDSSQ